MLRLKLSRTTAVQPSSVPARISTDIGGIAAIPWRAVALPTSATADSLSSWQHTLRNRLRVLLRLPDTLPSVPLNPTVESEKEGQDSTITRVITISAYSGRPIRLRVQTPKAAVPGSLPGIICIGGHGSSLNTPFEDPRYKQFATHLASSGALVVSVDLSRHETLDPGTTLMGERLLDACRAVDFLLSLPEVNRNHIGCAGLSLGGEMAMWLGAMDERVQAVCAMGFLTWMNQMERNHCMCWKLEGIREVCDFPDIYALIAPRPLLLQLGEKEPLEQFNIIQGQSAFRELKRAWDIAGQAQNVALRIHPGEHEVDLPSLLSFFLGN